MTFGVIRRYGDAIAFAVLGVIGLTAALYAAYAYGLGQAHKATVADFLMVEHTYEVVLPFLLTTVAAGAAGVAYTLARRAGETARQARREDAARRAAIVIRLQELYGDSLKAMFAIRLARRRVRVLAVRGADAGAWHMRRAAYQQVCDDFNRAAIEGERLRKMLDFDGAVLHDGRDTARILQPLQSQFGAPFGILDNVLRELDFNGATSGALDDEGLVPLPGDLVAYADNAHSGNLSFRKGAEQFDKFSAHVLERLRTLQGATGGP